MSNLTPAYRYISETVQDRDVNCNYRPLMGIC